MNVLLIGAGRMGLRHLRGLIEVGAGIHVVDIRPEAEGDVIAAATEYGLQERVRFYSSLKSVPFVDVKIDAAVMAETAQGRLERFEHIAKQGVKKVLMEKPVEQSRKRFREVVNVARNYGLRVRCDHYRRTLPFYAALRRENGPFHIVVTSGAAGLGCNGIHWLDFAAFITGSNTGKMLFGEIEETEIGSGRGSTFRDYGGRGLFAFEDGSRLFLSSSAHSSAPTILTITQPTRQCVVDQEKNLAIVYERDLASTKPTYLYGVDYSRKEVVGIETVKWWELTKQWIQWPEACEECLLPSLEDVMLGYELLFDMLETTGATEFPIT